ncbi:spindle and kinetochore-associated protein 3 isoform X2 [Oxyura jamaicensis]|uniref:spindle and kinetochore-associated protein 3 isoform X2 n=1 Tax=Oxyura jamaicensis TaxID=8884 RepID=UPI0015A72BD2|nr:spindle and kinetochore-associated protein 3 isoform X2 [Oxyura jamaicensis]
MAPPGSSQRTMDVSRQFFGKLRALALTLEREAKQLERALRREDEDYEEESPIRVLQDLHSEIRTLKEDVNASLGKSCSERQEINDFMKASEILMQRNAADLGKIRELFQKYGYKPRVKVSTEEQEVISDSKVSVQNKPDEEKADDVPHLPTCIENPPVPRDPLCNPQLSDFGLSQYAFSRPWSTVNGQQATNLHQESSKTKTPLKTRTPCILPKTPKCMLKMDDYECLTPKLEHFGISEHTMCMNEDYTMALIRKTAEASKNLLKKDDHEVNVAKTTSKEIMDTPGPKAKTTEENAADCMASPMVPVFCTPGLKIPSRTDSTMLSKSQEINKLLLPNHAGTPPLPDFETRWLKVKPGEKVESVTENDAKEKQTIEDSIPPTVSSDEYLKRLGDPSPPKIKQYDHLLSTPPPPEITRIPDDVLQILSKYNHKVDSSKAKKMETNAGGTTRFESDFFDYCNKENRKPVAIIQMFQYSWWLRVSHQHL